MKYLIMLFYSVSAFAGISVKTQGYGGAAWVGRCTNLTTAGTQSSQMSFDVSNYPTVKIGVNGSVFTLPIGTKTNVTLSSGVAVGVLLELSGDEDLVFHTYNQIRDGSQEQQLSFSLQDTHHLHMRQDSWTYSGGSTAAGDSYFCKYTR